MLEKRHCQTHFSLAQSKSSGLDFQEEFVLIPHKLVLAAVLLVVVVDKLVVAAVPAHGHHRVVLGEGADAACSPRHLFIKDSEVTRMVR